MKNWGNRSRPSLSARLTFWFVSIRIILWINFSSKVLTEYWIPHILIQYLCNKSCLRTCCTPGTFPGAGDAPVEKMETGCPEAYLPSQRGAGYGGMERENKPISNESFHTCYRKQRQYYGEQLKRLGNNE